MAALPEIHSRSIWRNPDEGLIPADEQLSRLITGWAQNDPITQEASAHVVDATDLLPPLADLVAQYAVTQLPKSVGAWHKLTREIYPEGLRVTPLPANIVTTLRDPLNLAEQKEFGATNPNGSVKRVCDVFHLIPVQESMNKLDQRLKDYNARHLPNPDRDCFRILDVDPRIGHHLGDISEQPGWALVSDSMPNTQQIVMEAVRKDLNAINCDPLSSLPLACHLAFTRAMAQENRLPLTTGDYWLPMATRVAVPVPDTEPQQHINFQFGAAGLTIRTCDGEWNGMGSCAVRRWENPTNALP